ncbi:sulfurtransferase TusA family protein [Pseudohoeflea suaedae]|uniref:Sulfurtransferase TusA family protein n=2 Tax=Pseudohoeflea suaedae TaxID=877384 RepID=A0A4R5PIZ1_9HYPH|nr:sulfurtransferase TusA family protein [Pseudohoeflea suaedae]
MRTRRHLRELVPGTVIEVETTDPLAVIDIPHFCQSEGHELVASAPADHSGHRFTIRRGRTASADRQSGA